MKIITQQTTETLFELACRVAETYPENTTNLKITKYKTSIEFILTDKMLNSVDIFTVCKYGEPSYFGTNLTRQTLDYLKGIIGNENTENLIYSIIATKLTNLI